jgi:hypothetical protein
MVSDFLSGIGLCPLVVCCRHIFPNLVVMDHPYANRDLRDNDPGRLFRDSGFVDLAFSQ